LTGGPDRAILRRLMNRPSPLPALAALALLLGATGCTTPCRELGDRICGCVPDGQTRTACQNDVKVRVADSAPTSDQQAYCSDLLGTCPDPGNDAEACFYMETCPGKVACGLAVPEPDAPPGSGGCNPLPAGALQAEPGAGT
jgi:hypothetical protein